MKTRTGFVSNSSASSFLLMVKKERWENLKEELHPYVRHVAEILNEAYMYPNYYETTVFGEDVICFCTMEDGGYWWGEMLDEYINPDIKPPKEFMEKKYANPLSDAFSAFQEKLKEHPEDVATIQMGWG